MKLENFRLEKILDDKIKNKKAKTVECDYAEEDIVVIK